MKTFALLILAGLAGILTRPPQEDPPAKKEAAKLRTSAVTRFFNGESERMAKEIQGSWTLMDYTDPLEPPTDGAASGFATFHEGFLTLIVSIDTFEERLFRSRQKLLLHSGAYRYRFDESGSLQLASVISYTNQNEDGELEQEPSGQAYEYNAHLQEGTLELRNSDGVVLSFRQVVAGEFPGSAIRKLEGRRGGQDHWEVDQDPPR